MGEDKIPEDSSGSGSEEDELDLDTFLEIASKDCDEEEAMIFLQQGLGQRRRSWSENKQ